MIIKQVLMIQQLYNKVLLEFQCNFNSITEKIKSYPQKN